MLRELKGSPAYLKRFPGCSDPRMQRLRQFLDNKVDFNWYDYGILPPVVDQFNSPCCSLIALGTTVSAHLSILMKMMVVYVLSYQSVIDESIYRDKFGISTVDCIKFFINTGACLEYHYPITVDMKKSSNGGEPGVGARVRIENFNCFEKKPKFETVCELIQKKGPLFAAIKEYEGFDFHKGEEVYKHCEDLLVRKVDKKTNTDVVGDDTSEDTLMVIKGDFDEQSSGGVQIKTRNGHAVCVIGFHLASKSLLIQNSYGTSFGVEGLALVDFECFLEFFGFPTAPYLHC